MTDPAGKSKQSNRTALVIGVVIAFVIITAVLFDKYVRNHIFPKNFGEVEPGLIYRSGQLSPVLVESTLDRHDIEVVLSLSHDALDRKPDQRAEVAACEKLGIDRLLFPLRGDGTGDPEVYATAIAAIHESVQAGRPVLIHCGAGVHRTGGVLACYRLLVQGWTAEAAFDEMKAYGLGGDGEKVGPYVNEHIETIANKLVELGVIERVPHPLPLLPVG